MPRGIFRYLDSGEAHLQSLIAHLPLNVEHWSNVPCILWDRALFGIGRYGAVSFEGRTTQAHRVAFRLFHGQFPKYFACHHCDIPACVNPHHLFDGTPAENSADCVAKGRRPKGREAPGHRGRKIDPDRVFDLTRAGCSRGEIARWLGCTQPHVTKIVLGHFRHA